MKRIARITIMTLLVCLVISVMGCANEGYVKPELPEGYTVEPGEDEEFVVQDDGAFYEILI